jgi:hypothetical protein
VADSHRASQNQVLRFIAQRGEAVKVDVVEKIGEDCFIAF